MKIFAVLLLFPTIAYGQLTTNLLNCAPDSKDNPPFKIQFQDKSATIVIRGNSYKLAFSKFSIDKNGYKWSVYQSKDLTVSTQLPGANYSNVFRNVYSHLLNQTSIDPLTSGVCN